MKRIILLLLFLGMAYIANAQWTKQDSLKLKRILDGKEELRLNEKVVNEIDLGGPNDGPRISTQKRWMQPDETLPTVPYEAVEEETDTLRAKTSAGNRLDLLKKMDIKLPKVVGIPLGRGVKLDKVALTRVTGLAKLQVPGSVRSLQVEVRFSGLDFMSVFTKKFWKRKERQRTQQTKQVLRSY